MSPPLAAPADLGFGLLFDRVPDAVIVAEVPSGRIVLWNPAASRMFGYSPEQAAEMPLETIIPPAYRQAHRVGFNHYTATGHGSLIDSGGTVELPALHASGAEIRVELSLSPVEGARVPGHFVLAILRDVTDRVRLEAERTERAHLEGVLLAVRTLEHELGNGLAAVQGNLQLALRSHGRSNDPTALLRAMEAVKRLAETVRRVRQVVQVEQTHWGPEIGATIDVHRSRTE